MHPTFRKAADVILSVLVAARACIATPAHAHGIDCTGRAGIDLARCEVSEAWFSLSVQHPLGCRSRSRRFGWLRHDKTHFTCASALSKRSLPSANVACSLVATTLASARFTGLPAWITPTMPMGLCGSHV